MRLNLSMLDALPPGVLRPGYARSQMVPGIVHIGLGNFHRAHQAWYLHRLMQAGAALDWAILGAGVRAYDADMREKLVAQDCLTTLVELDPASQSVEVIGAMMNYLPIQEDNRALVQHMADPLIRIVSLTVTEGGYYLDAAGAFDTGHADIQHDAAHPEAPRTAFGAMVQALRLRRARGQRPFTGLSCDNLQGNGAILRRCVTGLARLQEPGLADWIEAEGAFPNAMVDCIVPATSDALIADVAAMGIEDAAPVSHENFRQWVIEDRFCDGRPPWEEAGAILTADVHSYEAMKLRVLNGGHQLLANVGEVLGLETISDCMADADVAAFFDQVERSEILPFVAAVPETSPNDYLARIAERFHNPAIRDTTRRVAFDGSARHPGFLLPSLQDALAAGAPIDGLALAEALWARMCAGQREDGSEIAPNDPIWRSLQRAARAARDAPERWLEQRALYAELGADPRFRAAFARWLGIIWQDGARVALRRYNAGP